MVQKRFYKVDEVSEYLGFSENTIRKWIRLGMIPFARLNGGIRFDIQEIDKWTTRNKRGIYNG